MPVYASVLRHCWLCVRKTIRPVKNLSDEVLAWSSLWSEMQMICIWSSDATATLSSLVSLKSRLVSPFWCWLTQVFPGKQAITGVFHQWQYNTCCCTQIPIQQSNLSIIAVLCTQYLPVQPRPVVIIKWHCTTEKDVCNNTNGPHVNLCGVW